MRWRTDSPPDAIRKGGHPNSRAARRAISSIRHGDGKFVACGALEEHFWSAFAAAIGLAGRAQGRQQESGKPPARRSPRSLRARPPRNGGRFWPRADCCATIVASLEEAAARSAFRRTRPVRRRISRRRRAQPSRRLPVPIAPEFRGATGPKPSCRLDERLTQGFAAHQARPARWPDRRPRASRARRSGPIRFSR